MSIRKLFVASLALCLNSSFLGVVSLLLAATLASADVQTTFYVAPGGSDKNPGTEVKPFAAVEKARQAVRKVNKDMTSDIVVMLRDGVYPIDATIAFDADDSGMNGHNVIYRAEAAATPVISGGKPVVGWKKGDDGRWKAPAPVDDFRQLYVDGRRATRAKGDTPAGLELDGDDGYKTTDIAMADWKNPEDIEFCYVVVWSHTRCKVESIQGDGDRATITMLQPHFGYAKGKEGVNVTNPDRMYIENALELLDEPGEWYLDRKAKTVYYMPREGEDMTKVEVIAPAVEKLVDLQGTLDRPVHNLRFEGITFSYGTWLLPSKEGLVDVQANYRVNPDKPLERDGQRCAIHNEHLKSPANVVCRAAKSVRFDRCTFSKLGGAGLDIEWGSQDNTVLGCKFFDIAGTAVQVGDVDKDAHHPDDPRMIVKNNCIENCYIHDCGLDYLGSIGVCAGYTEGTVIAHNEIARLPYSGISVGWGWGEEDAGGGAYEVQAPAYETPTTAKDNRIEYNKIHECMSQTDDGAGIYTLGNQPGTLIRGNHIYDCKNPESKRNWSSGVYLDEGSGFIEVTGNLVHDVPIPASYNNKKQDRLATCNEHDNYLGGDPEEAKIIVNNAGLDPAFRDLSEEIHKAGP